MNLSTIYMSIGTVGMSVGAVQLPRLLGRSLDRLFFFHLCVFRVTGIRSIDISFQTFPISWVTFHNPLVSVEGGIHLLSRDIIEENTGAKWAWNGSTQETVSR